MSTFDAQGNKHAGHGKPDGGRFETQGRAEVEVGEERVQLLVGDVGVNGHAGAEVRERGPRVKRPLSACAAA